jgi:metal-responsive CopG/Arc/MetJ family transcriptional regulator
MLKNQFDPLFFLEYKSSMKVKTSITISQELLEVVDVRARQSQRNRSDFIETALRIFIQQLERGEQNAKDLEIINRRADYLNREAAEVLTYQAPL